MDHMDKVFAILDNMDTEDKDNFIYETLQNLKEKELSKQYECYVNKNYNRDARKETAFNSLEDMVQCSWGFCGIVNQENNYNFTNDERLSTTLHITTRNSIAEHYIIIFLRERLGIGGI